MVLNGHLFSFQVTGASVGQNADVFAHEDEKGGLLTRSLTGDYFRVWESKPQVQPGFKNPRPHQFQYHLSVKCVFSLERGLIGGLFYIVSWRLKLVFSAGHVKTRCLNIQQNAGNQRV